MNFHALYIAQIIRLDHMNPRGQQTLVIKIALRLRQQDLAFGRILNRFTRDNDHTDMAGPFFDFSVWMR